ncbi:MAG: aldo/keto reductase [Chloroherpetonaceae bacterium]|nr:aldo/keto reductase [Chloroherpetonaceae bacterium]
MNYKLLGKSGLRVSEFALGTMTFGTEWGWGSDYETSKKVFDTYVKADGNFLDTANRYTEGTSEKWLGEFIKHDRDKFVVATKYTLFDRQGDPSFSGNHKKNMMRSVRDSLKRLGTDYIDLLWVHAWDFTTPVEEVLRGLDDLIRNGSVLYIGISDTPAWVVSQLNTMADLRGWSRFIALQIEYSLLQRTPERDLLPMAKAFDMAVTPWGAIGGGALTGKYLKGESGRVPTHSARRSDRANSIATIVLEVAETLGVSPAQVAIQWSRQNNQQTIPIIGARSAEQLEDNLKTLGVVIPPELMTKLNDISKIELGFPHDFLTNEPTRNVIFGSTQHRIQNHRV